MEHLKLIIPAFILLLSSSCVSYKVFTEDQLTRTEVISTQGKQDDLYVRANNWFVESFTDAESVIQFSDKESGSVSGKYVDVTQYYNFRSVIMVDIKDDKVRITSKSPTARSTGSKYDYQAINTNTKLEYLHKSWDVLFDSFRRYITDSSNAEW